MSNRQRLEFVTSHFEDLQTIRFAALPLAMLAVPVVVRIPHIWGPMGLPFLAIFVLGGIGFYWWSTVAIKRRYGSVKALRVELVRRQQHPAILVLSMIMLATLLWFHFFAPSTRHTDLYLMFIVLIVMLQRILDAANPTRRRVVWAIGLVALFGGGALLRDVDGGKWIFALGGAVWLSISIFDFLLLRRTFAGNAAFPSSGNGEEPVAQYG